jgi:hypothetical protein
MRKVEGLGVAVSQGFPAADEDPQLSGPFIAGELDRGIVIRTYEGREKPRAEDESRPDSSPSLLEAPSLPQTVHGFRWG